ncbi:MAG TPA: hypothetical protein DEF85_02060 [Clostridiaceae bacterium]|nr:hypothetical protein [Clostridiaceae bacterium]
MGKFKIMKGNNNKEDEREIKRTKLYNIYVNAFDREMNKNKDDFPEKPDNINKLITYGIRIINLEPEQEVTLDKLEAKFGLMEMINYFIGQLKPQELMSLYPIEKTYDGDKHEMKDYFYTKKFMDSLPQNKPINPDSILEVLWEYMNTELRIYTVNYTSTMDKLAMANGEKGAMEQFLDDTGIGTYTMHEDSNGKKYIVDSTGKTRRINTGSGNFKVVKGGKQHE